jgi:hypothetical protein
VKARLYVPAHTEQLDVVDWFVVVAEVVLALSLAARCIAADSSIHALAASGWMFAASNYYTARKRFNPQLHRGKP